MTGLSASSDTRLKALFALSRTVQAHLSIAQPALAALVAARGVPPLRVIVVGFVAAWAGFHAVFAINDVIDYQLDRARFAHLKSYQGFDIDSALMRHPLAQGYLRRRHALAWIGGLAVVAIGLAALLSWISVWLFCGAVALEALYCWLARISAWKFLISGLMVGLGALAGWFPVTSSTGWATVWVFVWMATWEIGGRNIVNDWSDVEEDVLLGIRTVPVQFGTVVAGRLLLGFNVAATLAGAALAPAAGLPAWYIPMALLVGAVLLVVPSWRLARDADAAVAHRLFNRASFYPPVMVVVVGAGYVLGDLAGWLLGA
ncbi:MAG: 4-hydroxybenzoate octaprenyltransferase [Acidimicrobiales bacterium]|nr:MAG: hypothetical protein EDR02_11615 [Actinomycetota bacterium]MBV6508043.1 4-hydroxybenzoate octaprenyltransferase [Acidimicrobiales bacterium]RIK05329.1 MAG: hypothetical protein DCC48_10655 [Acidobacteriota bacterium]